VPSSPCEGEFDHPISWTLLTGRGVQRRLISFLSEHREFFSTLTQDDITERSKSLKSILTDPPTSYLREATGIWGRILEDVPHDYLLQVDSFA
jgi:hypothetical protein